MRRRALTTFMMCAGLVACSSSTNDVATTVTTAPDIAGSTLFLKQETYGLDALADTTLLITADGCVYLGARSQESVVGVWPLGTTVDVPHRRLILADGTQIDSGADVLVGGGFTEIYDGLITEASDTPSARSCWESTDSPRVYMVGDIRVGNLPD
ncbi:MAG: hypothetical protein ABMA25_09535 [Ilumatobacteraceae bacterium]